MLRLWTLLLAHGALFVGNLCGCGVNWTIPTNHFDGVNERGHVSIWKSIGEIDLGDELKLPLIVHFRSDRTRTSPFLGDGWLFPLIESYVTQLDERNYVLVQPDGQNRYFYRKSPSDRVLKDNSGWVARIDDRTFVAYAECGWKLEFANGKLTTITTPKNRVLRYEYGGGKVASISEGGKTFLSVAPDDGHLTVQGRTISLHMGDRPIVSRIENRNLITRMTRAFHHAKGTDHGSIYEFNVDGDLHPSITIDHSRTITWDPSTGHVLSDGDWRYQVFHPHKAANSPLQANAASYASISRINSSNITESIFDDKLKGKRTILTSDGVSTVTSYFTSGPMSGNLRQVEKVANGKSTVVEKLSYDERGRVLRWQRPDGTIDLFKYNPDGSTDQTVVQSDGTWTTQYLNEKGHFLKSFSSNGDEESCIYAGDRLTKTKRNSVGQVLKIERYEEGLLKERETPGKRCEVIDYVPGTSTIASITWNNKKVYRNLFDSQGRLVGQTLNGLPIWQLCEGLAGECDSARIYYNLSGKAIKATDLAGSASISLDSILSNNPQLKEINIDGKL